MTSHSTTTKITPISTHELQLLNAHSIHIFRIITYKLLSALLILQQSQGRLRKKGKEETRDGKG